MHPIEIVNAIIEHQPDSAYARPTGKTKAGWTDSDNEIAKLREELRKRLDERLASYGSSKPE